MQIIPAVNIPTKGGEKNFDIFSMLLNQRIIYIIGGIL